MHRYVNCWVYSPKPDTPDPNSIEVLEMIRTTELFDRFRHEPHTEAANDEQVGINRLDGRRRAYRGSNQKAWTTARDLAEHNRLAIIGRHLMPSPKAPLRPFPPMVNFTLGHACDPTKGTWKSGFTLGHVLVQLPIFETDVPARWLDIFETLLRDITIALNSHSAWVMPSAIEAANPRGLFIKTWMPDVNDPPLDAVVGLAPLFIIGPHALPRYGGLDQLTRDAPVHSITPLHYRHGEPGALVRMGTDHTDVCKRWDDTLAYFGDTIRTPPPDPYTNT